MGQRSCFIEAIQAAKEGDFERADALMKEGEEQFVEDIEFMLN